MFTEEMMVKMFLTGCKRKLSSIIQKWYEAPVSEMDDELEGKAPPANERSENPMKSH